MSMPEKKGHEVQQTWHSPPNSPPSLPSLVSFHTSSVHLIPPFPPPTIHFTHWYPNLPFAGVTTLWSVSLFDFVFQPWRFDRAHFTRVLLRVPRPTIPRLEIPVYRENLSCLMIELHILVARYHPGLLIIGASLLNLSRLVPAFIPPVIKIHPLLSSMILGPYLPFWNLISVSSVSRRLDLSFPIPLIPRSCRIELQC